MDSSYSIMLRSLGSLSVSRTACSLLSDSRSAWLAPVSSNCPPQRVDVPEFGFFFLVAGAIAVAYSIGRIAQRTLGLAGTSWSNYAVSLMIATYRRPAAVRWRKSFVRGYALLKAQHAMPSESSLDATMFYSVTQCATHMRIPMDFTFQNYRQVVLVGGGARTSTFTAKELRGVLSSDGLPVSWNHAEYRLVDYVPLHRIDLDSERHRAAFVAALELSAVSKKLDIRELRQLAGLHGIYATTRTIRRVLLDLLEAHVCTDVCEKAYAVLSPQMLVSTGTDSHVDVESDDFVASFRTIPARELADYIHHVGARPPSKGYSVVGVHRVEPESSAGTGDTVARNLPLALLAKYTTIQSLKRLAAVHGMTVPSKWSKPQIACALRDHECTSCPPLFFTLRPNESERASRKTGSKRKGSWLDSSDEPLLWQAFVEIAPEQYPPRPTTMRDVATAMARYCEDMSPESVVQAGCAVCGQLKLRSAMRAFDLSNYESGLLEEIGCTRQERVSESAPICGLGGPVVDQSLRHVCPDCDEHLLKGKRPKEALANQLWLGDVPACLKDLTLGECALISRVRYNQCVVRVSQGHAKMIANVIAFEHPSKKIYQRLPMPADELTEVLSIVYTGVEPPSDSDLSRTPVLVRRKRVQDALEWLKLNHKDYADLEIDYETLNAYPLESVPIGLLRRDTWSEGGNILAAAKSVFDNDVEEGTTSGMCPYAVSGLTAEQHGSLTTTQRKAIGLLNLKNGGSSLAVGHDSVPQSMWNNPGLYPQMYPWLFPNGYGGVGQDCHLSSFGRQAHIKWLLGYHDKRFQRDAGFLIVAMNHQLIRQSSRGSFISMKRGNFARAADAIDKLDPGVLLSVVEKTKDGGRFFPQTPEERKCATLMDQVDVVGSYVDGSLARKKFQRGELWSLINFCNAPHWFITISPADSKHPLCVHWASNDTEFLPEIKGYKERQHLVTRNPVACALFFDHVVNLFIKHICGWSSEDGEIQRGLFGVPGAYYGTVEEQGRKTLHLHFLLWIKGQLPLHVVRERLMSEDSEFQRELSEYIESCMKGEFFTGSKDEVEASVPVNTEVEDRGIHTILVDSDNADASYRDPTLTMPESPPQRFLSRRRRLRL